jgi:hypothetical protein
MRRKYGDPAEPYSPSLLTKQTMILGVSTNSRVLGMAVIDSQSLRDYKTCLFKEKWSSQKRERILATINTFAQEHGVDRVAIHLPPQYHLTKGIEDLIGHIRSYCRRYKLPLNFYRSQALEYFSGSKRAKKKALMRELSLRFPELTFLLEKELRNRKRYYIKLFEATGAAFLAKLDL